MVSAPGFLVDHQRALEEGKRAVVLARAQQQGCQAVQQRNQLRVLSAERVLVDGDPALVAASRLRVPAQSSVGQAQIAQRGCDLRMILAEGSAANGERPFVCRQRVFETSDLSVERAQVVERGRHLGMVGAERLFADEQGPLVILQRLRVFAQSRVRDSQVGERVGHFGIFGPARALLDRQRTLDIFANPVTDSLNISRIILQMLALALLLMLAQSDELSERDLRALVYEERPVDESSLRRMVEQVLPKVSKVMRLPGPRHLTTRIVSREEAGRKLLEVLRREYPGDRLARLGAALELIHLLEPGVDLPKEAVALYSKNVSGFYDPHDRALYLLKDQPPSAQKMVIAHELAHAVQDEKLGLEQAVRASASSEDAQMALSAAFEGNAQAVAAAVLVSGIDEEAEALSSLLTDGVAEAASLSAQASGATPWLALQLSFPYAAGAQLIRAISSKDDPVGMKVLWRLPASTAQVVDTRLYQLNEKPLQGSIGLARLIPGAQPFYETTLGRANLDLLGEIHADGKKLGEGWRGDRLEMVQLGKARCAVWAIAFGQPAQADRFATSYAHLIEARTEGSGHRVVEADRTVSAVSRRDATAVVLARVPADRAGAVEEAARRALR